MTRRAAWAVMGVSLAVLMTTSGCAAPSSGVRAVDSVPAGSACGVTMTWDWVGSPGAATRADALDDITEYFRDRQINLEATGAQAGAGDGLDDPLDVRIAIRNLEELARALQLAESAARAEEDLLVEADVEQSGVVASALIIAMPAGGYRLDTLVAPGQASDDPTCVE